MKIDLGNGFYRKETKNGLDTKNGCSDESVKRIYSDDGNQTSVIFTSSTSTAFQTLERLKAQSLNKVVEIFECILQDCPSANEFRIAKQYVDIKSAEDQTKITLEIYDWNKSNSSFMLKFCLNEYIFSKKQKPIDTVTNNNNKIKPFNNQVNYFDQFFNKLISNPQTLKKM